MKVLDQCSGRVSQMINFAGNDYLNLTRHPETIRAGIEALQEYGTGAGSAPLLGGTFTIHDKLVKKIARFKSTESAIIHTSGFGNNFGVLRAILSNEDLAVIDQYSHASMVDGTAHCVVRTFRHNDMNSLENIMRINSRKDYQTRIICVDGVYSMDGDIAPLPEILEIARKYNAYVYVDDAHGLGVLGKTGKGTSEHFDLEGKIDIVAGTLSKAVGSVGGFIASTSDLIEYLHYYSRSYMFSTFMAPQAAGSAIAALDIIISESERRKQLWENINYLKENLTNLGFNIGKTQTAIFPVIVGDDYIAKDLAKYLEQNNILVSLVSYPAVPKELSRIRISLSQGHSRDELDALIYHLEYQGKMLGII